MNCRETLRVLCDYLDGELNPEVLQELKRHLEHCDDCRIVVNTCQKTVELYCNSEPVPLPLDVKQRLHQVLAERMKGRTS